MTGGRFAGPVKAIGSMILLAALIDGGLPGWLVVALVGAGLVYGAWRSPPVTAGVVLLIAAVNGGVLILLAAPAVVLLAARASAIDGPPVTGHRGLRTFGAAAAAFVLTLPFTGLALGDPIGGGGADPSPFDETGSESWLQRLIDRLLGRDGQAEELVGAVPGAVQVEPESSTNWWMVLALFLILLAIVLAVLWWRRRRRSPELPSAGWSLARLEAIGSAVGRRRRPHEGPIAYASALSSHTGDQRLESTGPLVSAGLYESATADDDRTAASLRGLESTPPTKPRRSWRDRLALGATLRRYALVLVAIAAIIAAVVILVARGGDLTAASPATGATLAEVLQAAGDGSA